MMAKLHTLTPLLLALALAGCATAPGSSPSPVVDLPVATASTTQTVAADWWKLYRDPQLDALVAEALQNNTDLARALARIDEARASLRLAQADSAPVVSAGVGATRQRSSETGAQPVGPSPVTTDIRATLNVSYEVDLWGRLAAGSRAAREGLAATVYTRDALRTTLVGAFLAVAFGVTDEVHQSFVPGRNADLMDLVADTLGASLGAVIAAVWGRRSR